jgi:16S rRNA (uracil1498-N3)-methyltransferase
VERDDRSSVASFFLEATFAVGERVALSDAQLHHARVKRLEVDDAVRLTDGRGAVATGRIASLGKNDGEVAIERVATVPRPTPIHLRVPIGDRDRMLMLAEKATELGIASWQGVRYRRSASVNPRGEGIAFSEKVRGRMIGALEQSGGAWMPRILTDVAPAIASMPATATPLLLDVEGKPLLDVFDGGEAVVAFGPEGGLEVEEREALVAAGWIPAMLGNTTLRFETAGIAAVAIIRAAQITKEQRNG